MKKFMLQSSAALFLMCIYNMQAIGAECRVNGSVTEVSPYVYEIKTTIQGSVSAGQITLDGYNLQCRFFGDHATPINHTDYWDSLSPGLTLGSKLAALGGGLKINGTAYALPVPNGIRIATMPWAGGGPWVNINVFSYVNLIRTPTNPINIYVGEQVAEFKLDQTNNYNGQHNTFYYRLIAANNFSIQPSACTVNNNNPIEVDFGTVSAGDIGESATSTAQRVNARITYQCPDPGITQPITVTLNGTGASFNSQALQMSNNDLGVSLIRAGAVVPLNTAFRSTISNSVGGDDVTFALIKRAGTSPAAGPSSGSGVLILGVP